MQHYSQKPRHVNNLNVHSQMDEKRKCVKYVHLNIIQPHIEGNPATCDNIDQPGVHFALQNICIYIVRNIFWSI